MPHLKQRTASHVDTDITTPRTLAERASAASWPRAKNCG